MVLNYYDKLKLRIDVFKTAKKLKFEIINDLIKQKRNYWTIMLDIIWE